MPMLTQVPFMGTSSLTDVGPLYSVQSFMLNQAHLFSKAFETDTTDMAPFTSVCPLMIDQVCFPSKSLPTDGAG